MTELAVTQFDGELRADSRAFAEKLDVRHRQILVLIRKYEEVFARHGRVVFQKHTMQTGGGEQEQIYALLS